MFLVCLYNIMEVNGNQNCLVTTLFQIFLFISFIDHILPKL